MTRRSTKKALKRAEIALREERYLDAAATYEYLLCSFAQETPSLLDHAAAIWGKVVALQALGKEREADWLAESAVEILSVHAPMHELAA